MLHGVHCRGRPRGDADLVVDVLDVVGCSAMGNHERSADLLLRGAARDQSSEPRSHDLSGCPAKPIVLSGPGRRQPVLPRPPPDPGFPPRLPASITLAVAAQDRELLGTAACWSLPDRCRQRPGFWPAWESRLWTAAGGSPSRPAVRGACRQQVRDAPGRPSGTDALRVVGVQSHALPIRRRQRPRLVPHAVGDADPTQVVKSAARFTFVISAALRPVSGGSFGQPGHLRDGFA